MAKRQPSMRLEPHRLVFIDETGTTTKMTRLRGRCLKGWRPRSKAPFGHWKTQTFLGALDANRRLLRRRRADERPIFGAYVENNWSPCRGRCRHSRQSRRPQEQGRRRHQGGRRKDLFLPPYSPDFNPCMDGSCGSRIGSALVNRSVAAMYTASECATGSLRALMNIRLENRSHSIERARGASD